ncbi:MAG: hypothetical protein QG578_885 [Thermodesulfobacteriota bacterium]|nr:hypothetical protein [Thermodesulfobacteriota bacterium]
MKNLYLRLFASILTVISLLLLNSCAGVRLKTIPAPPPTAKLRVYVQAISAPFPFKGGAGHWDSFHKAFVARQIEGIERYLNETGIYEVVTEQDVRMVIGEENPSYIEMTKNKRALSREIGKALHAEYVFVIERRAEPDKVAGIDQYFTVNLINTGSGKLYEASAKLDRFDRASNSTMSVIIKKLYQTVFLSAKNDMFGTAIMKSEKLYLQDTKIVAEPVKKPQILPQVTVKPVTSPEPEPISAVPEPELIAAAPEPEPIAVLPKSEPPVTGKAPKAVSQTPPAVHEKPVTPPEPEPVIPIPKAVPEIGEKINIPDTAQEKPRHQDKGMDKLVICDLNAPEQYRTVALIITEVLREELFLLNKFILVNRENLLDVNREMALQQSGLIDEKQAVKTGKGLAANQVVTGSLGILGKTYFLQAKRIDVETFATLGMASTKFSKGEEEDVLGRLPGLAKSLAGMR